MALEELNLVELILYVQDMPYKEAIEAIKSWSSTSSIKDELIGSLNSSRVGWKSTRRGTHFLVSTQLIEKCLNNAEGLEQSLEAMENLVVEGKARR